MGSLVYSLRRFKKQGLAIRFFCVLIVSIFRYNSRHSGREGLHIRLT